jgi:hypothetical protein
MNTRPNTSQADRDVLENLGLADVLERAYEPVLLHVEEPMPT